MRLLWEDRAWEDYLYWQMQDKKTLKRINALIKDYRPHHAFRRHRQAGNRCAVRSAAGGAAASTM